MKKALEPPANDRTWRWVLFAWLICCAVMIWLFRSDFVSPVYSDPDDALRLQQVRDWISGQPFFDVSQHRVNPPFGGPMHWSRIVDMPIAALILLLRPLMGAAHAEMVASTTMPLLLLGGTVWALYRAARNIGSASMALLAVLLLIITPTILIQFTPFRIDHHGWQIWMGTIALAAAFGPRPRRSGVICGLAMAVWLQISSEGLPYAALFGGVLALRFLLAEEERPRFVAYALTIGVGAFGLLVLTRGVSAPLDNHCDVLSAAYIWPLLAFSVAGALTTASIRSVSVIARASIVIISGGAAVATFAWVGGQCLSGDPFRALGPVAYEYWYIHVMEGRPIWEQDLAKRGLILLPSLIGLVGCLLAARADKEARTRWLFLALLLCGATAVSIMVMRSVGMAHLMALPGAAWLILDLLRRVQASPMAGLRVLGTAALVFLTPVGASAVWGIMTAKSEPDGSGETCQTAAALATLGKLPPATLFAPLDLGPEILVRTHHSVIGTAHHRNAAGITSVIQGYTVRPEKARTIIADLRAGRGADYVVTCNNLNEIRHYGKTSPYGLAAVLLRGQHPDWLAPLPSSGPLRIYRVLRQPGRKASAAPLMQ